MPPSDDNSWGSTVDFTKIYKSTPPPVLATAPHSFHPTRPSMLTRLVMRLSAGRITTEAQATYVLIAVGVACVVITCFVIRSSQPPALPRVPLPGQPGSPSAVHR